MLEARHDSDAVKDIAQDGTIEPPVFERRCHALEGMRRNGLLASVGGRWTAAAADFTAAAKLWTLCEKSANISGSILSVPGTTCTTRRDRNVFSAMRNRGAGLEPIGLSEIRVRAASRLLICRSHLRKSKSTSEGVSARMMRDSFLVSGKGVRCKSRVGHRSFGPERFRALPSKTRRRLFQRG